MKRTACECRLNNIVLNNPVGFWSAPVGLLLGCWPVGNWNRKGGGGLLWDKASAKLFAEPGKCTADRSRFNRAGIKCRRHFRRMNAGSLLVPVLRVCVCQAVGCVWQMHSK